MKDFFFDTANVDYIRETWNKIKHKVDSNAVRGITTNPNAFFKIEKHGLQDWLDHLPELCKVVTEIRGDDEGEVYVQGPWSGMSPMEQLIFAEMVEKYSDGHTKISLKIPPYVEILKIVPSLNFFLKGGGVNVTGVSDACTALKCLSYQISFMSIIPGRMEEAGIDSASHLSYLQQRDIENTGEVISGSMRTLDGLITTFRHGTVPTIGERVWNLLLEDGQLDYVINASVTPTTGFCYRDPQPFAPLCNEINVKLSQDFFTQMDKCGEIAYADFKALPEVYFKTMIN